MLLNYRCRTVHSSLFDIRVLGWRRIDENPAKKPQYCSSHRKQVEQRLGNVAVGKLKRGLERNTYYQQEDT